VENEVYPGLYAPLLVLLTILDVLCLEDLASLGSQPMHSWLFTTAVSQLVLVL